MYTSTPAISAVLNVRRSNGRPETRNAAAASDTEKTNAPAGTTSAMRAVRPSGAAAIVSAATPVPSRSERQKCEP